ncbi:glutathione S-transferase N-terminal domain-containing protein [Brevundimonas denitrificans]|uniref:glutathione S-transferase N-terminal domain-containing protein n=1 Tax=Brevundimonas denitrificans TaxID=1443434 RepID=UPI00223B84E3|nr:glutathione S-transferase N-terminal domain-containing protein [Brevundimonas denitrificans]
MKLILGDKAYSTWSLRPWLVLRRCGADFNEVMVPLNRPDTAEAIARHAPAGKVPALQVDGVTIWDSLAITLWAEERFPDVALWPADAKPAGWRGPRCARCTRPSGPCGASWAWRRTIPCAWCRTSPTSRPRPCPPTSAA